MHEIVDWQRYMSVAGVIASLALLVKLRLNGLLPVYRWFGAYLLGGSLAAALLLCATPHSNQYAILWICVKPLEWILGVGVVLEIHSLVLDRYPGIASVTQWAIVAGVAVSLVLSVVSLNWDFHNPNERFPLLRLAFATQRTVDGVMVWSLLMPWLLMARFPIRLCRNVLLHAFLFSTCVGMEAMAMFARNLLGGGWLAPSNLAMTVGMNLCLLGWIAFLGRKGERAEKIALKRVSPEREYELVEQLKAFNRTLLRATAEISSNSTDREPAGILPARAPRA